MGQKEMTRKKEQQDRVEEEGKREETRIKREAWYSRRDGDTRLSRPPFGVRVWCSVSVNMNLAYDWLMSWYWHFLNHEGHISAKHKSSNNKYKSEPLFILRISLYCQRFGDTKPETISNWLERSVYKDIITRYAIAEMRQTQAYCPKLLRPRTELLVLLHGLDGSGLRDITLLLDTGTSPHSSARAGCGNSKHVNRSPAKLTSVRRRLWPEQVNGAAWRFGQDQTVVQAARDGILILDILRPVNS